MNFFKLLGGVLLSAALVACGGGGGSPGANGSGTGNNGGGTSTPVTTQTAAVSDFVLYIDKTSINNGGTEKVRVTVVTVDASNNVVPGASVGISVPTGAVAVKSAAVTDQAGSLYADISLGTDRTNREIPVNVTVNGVTKSTSFQVVGSVLTISPSPANPAAGDPVTLSLSLKDSAGTNLPGLITFSGDVPGIANVVGTTSGVPNAIFSAPADGVYTIVANGGGVSASTQIVVATGGGGLPAAVIPAGVTPSLAISPIVLPVNATGAANQSTLRALFLTPGNAPIPNVRVRFEKANSGNGVDQATIGTGAFTVYSNSSGQAISTLISGNTSSPTNGVVIRACYKATDFTSAADCPQSVTATMTIAAQALGISIGDDGNLIKETGVYIQRLAVTVVDSAGRAVVDAPVDISLDITHYGKGTFEQTPTFSLATSEIGEAYPDLTTTPAAFNARISCPNEDVNRNGFVDGSENINNSEEAGAPSLEPRRADILVSYADPSVTKTDASGRLLIQVTYLQSVATWEVYRVRASTNVGGSQGTADRAFVTKYIAGDEQFSGAPFRTPPYGVGACDEAL